MDSLSPLTGSAYESLWFNTRRLLEPSGYVPVAGYEARYCEEQAEVA